MGGKSVRMAAKDQGLSTTSQSDATHRRKLRLIVILQYGLLIASSLGAAAALYLLILGPVNALLLASNAVVLAAVSGVVPTAQNTLAKIACSQECRVYIFFCINWALGDITELDTFTSRTTSMLCLTSTRHCLALRLSFGSQHLSSAL